MGELTIQKIVVIVLAVIVLITIIALLFGKLFPQTLGKIDSFFKGAGVSTHHSTSSLSGNQPETLELHITTSEVKSIV